MARDWPRSSHANIPASRLGTRKAAAGTGFESRGSHAMYRRAHGRPQCARCMRLLPCVRLGRNGTPASRPAPRAPQTRLPGCLHGRFAAIGTRSTRPWPLSAVTPGRAGRSAGGDIRPKQSRPAAVRKWGSQLPRCTDGSCFCRQRGLRDPQRECRIKAVGALRLVPPKFGKTRPSSSSRAVRRSRGWG